MAIVMVDTNVYSYTASRTSRLGAQYERHLMGNTVALSFITVGEQYAGYLRKISRGEWTKRHLERMEQRLSLAVVVPYDLEICKIFGQLRTLKNPDGSDRTIGVNDLWIASCAMRYSLPLVTHNRRDFENIPQLNIICEAPSVRPVE